MINSGSKIATPQQLADLRLARNESGRHVYPRYKDGDVKNRIAWLGNQFFGLAALLHTNLTYDTVSIDCAALDSEIMDNSSLRDLTIIEMQEAFRKGINKEYGEYYGLNSVSMLGFLKGFMRSEKKQAASAIIYKEQERQEQEADARFFRELYLAQKEGKIELPDFSHMRVTNELNKD